MHCLRPARLLQPSGSRSACISRSSGLSDVHVGTTAPLPLPLQPRITLEAPVGAPSALDEQLAGCGAFGALVTPDLPIATTWSGLARAVLPRIGLTARRGGEKPAPLAAANQAMTQPAASSLAATATAAAGTTTAHVQDVASRPSLLRVTTVAVQLRGRAQAESALHAAAASEPDALLLVSGSHPLRQLPPLSSMLPGSLQLLRAAQHARDSGQLPSRLQLWAVANPVTERGAGYLQAKIEAGASVVLTQPPLDWPAFEAWMDDVTRRRLHQAAQLLIGFPALTSAGGVAFWAALCGAPRNAECVRLQRSFADAEAAGRGAEFAAEWNEQLLTRLTAIPGVAGLHVMPIGAGAKRLALSLASRGALAAVAEGPSV